jgi:hypothetical protein
MAHALMSAAIAAAVVLFRIFIGTSPVDRHRRQEIRRL